MVKKLVTLVIGLIALFPTLVIAQEATTTNATTVSLGLAERVAGFYTWALALGGLLALGVIIYGGVLYSASAGNPGRIDEAKKWIQHAVFGLILLFSSFIVLNFINPDLTTLDEILIDQNPDIIVSEIPAIEGQIAIDAARNFGEIIGGIGDPALVPSGTAQELAKRILAHPKIGLSGDARTKTIERIANGQPALVAASNTTRTSTNVSINLLGMLLAAADAGHNVYVTGITTGPHGEGSQHYFGQAADIRKNDALYAWFFRERQTIGASSLIHNFAGEVPCGSRLPTGTRPSGSYNLFGGQKGNTTRNCHDLHIHISVFGESGESSGSSGTSSSGGSSSGGSSNTPQRPGGSFNTLQ